MECACDSDPCARKMSLLKQIVLAVSFLALLSIEQAHSHVGDDYFDLDAVCNVKGSSNTSGKSLPSFPQQFSVQIEASLTNQNRLTGLVEYYDGLGQRGRIDAFLDVRSTGPPTRFTLVADYKSDQGFHIAYPDSDSASCDVVALENDRFTNFIFHTFSGPNGTVRIGSANDLLMFGGRLKDNETYIGLEFARGVLTDHWRYCYLSLNISFALDYYFAVEGWELPQNGSRIPILATVYGMDQDDDGKYPFSHTYTFTAFDSSPLDDEVFAIPEGLVCRNRKNLKPLPPLDVKYFSSLTEVTNNTSGHASYIPFYYDRQANLVRYDFNYRNRSDPTRPLSRISIIHDFSQGVQYWINRDNGTCNISSLSTGRRLPDEVMDEQGNYIIASLLHILSPFNDSASAYVYEGPSTVRGIPAEAWLAFVQMSDSRYPNVTIENVTNLVYFSADNWVVNGRNTKMQLPLRVRTRGTAIYNDTMHQFDFTSNIFNVDLQEPPFEVFDAFVCFPPDQTKEVMFTLPVSPAVNTLFDLRSNIRTALSSFTGAPGSQFGNIQVSLAVA